MSLISIDFFVFFLILLVVYYMLPAGLQWIWLLIGGAFFYYKNATVTQCIIFLAILLINYVASLNMTAESKHNKAVFRSVLIFDVLLLMVMKYAGFFFDIYAFIAGLFSHVPDHDAALIVIDGIGRLCPPRISYFSLIIIGYITDVYWGRIDVQKNIGKFALFASYFPQMTSGPIVSYDNMERSLWGSKHSFSYDRLISGLMRIMWGIFKKLVISERLAVIVNEIYDRYEIYPGFYIFFAAACFAFQLFTDFSGLMDIVLGFSELLDIPLPENFNNPFYSTSLAQFWRRWHITLGAWLRTYVFYAVQQTEAFRRLRKFCKKKLGKGYEHKCNIPQFLGLLISWFLIGLWHGGGWNYIFGVGIYMGVVIIISELCQPLFNKIVSALKINTEAFSYTLFKRIRTFFLFIFGLSFFRAESLREGFLMWKTALSEFNPWIFMDRSLYSLGINETEFHILTFSMLILLTVSMFEHRFGEVKENADDCTQMRGARIFLLKQNYLFRLLLFLALFVLILCWGYYGSQYNASDFIYGRF